MIKKLLRFLSPSKNEKNFDKTYRDAYNRQWINNIRDYYP